jgi:hypothetical protein
MPIDLSRMTCYNVSNSERKLALRDQHLFIKLSEVNYGICKI